MEVEAKAEAKNNYEKVPNKINNTRFKIIAGKINKSPEFYTVFALKIALLHNKTTRSRPGRGQMF